MTTTTNSRRATLTAALAVAAGAGMATAHGLYEVAVAARVPAPVAWLYPLITDGLALVAYAAATRLHSTGRRYAAAIVVLAAGLSGLAQAINLAGGIHPGAVAPAGLRFGVGAWPAIAAALTAHLLHLIGTDNPTAAEEPAAEPRSSSTPYSEPVYNVPFTPTVQPRPPVQPDGVQPEAAYNPAPAVNRPARSNGAVNPRDRARDAGRAFRDQHGHLPTVTQLAEAAHVARGTAAKALHGLKAERPPLHIINAQHHERTDP